ncbi:GNAT family N-acetyltransferase [Vibrio sp. HA2012]|uniref:GNAT family N-acetyltransferase n=1 Tax=Vibrio sp. HA2012 TaxID=1971595 RepID=UPI000C2CAFE8|nr:GNAT family N-acetyltransferase [Vibrio sp. HA2012]PJC87012.1 GNAT family N-acetyltransferase [Vibrio sp. HA2012]
MIRKYIIEDIDAVLDIWLSASIKAHDFVAPSFWQAQVENMRNIYLPSSDVYVFEEASKVVGFYALYADTLAAIFVHPELQGQGIGKELMAHAKTQREKLTLSVYKANEASYQFYLSQGFMVISEQQDEHTGYLEYTMSLST